MTPKKPDQPESLRDSLRGVGRATTVAVSLRLPKDLTAELDELAKKLSTSRTQLIEKTLQWALPAVRDAAQKGSK